MLYRAEYFARYNLGHDVPFEPYTNGIVSYTDISSASRGAIRPTWELLYNHYVKVKGLEAPWTTAYLNNSLEYFGGYEGGAGSWGEGSGHYDGLGWGSLLYHLDDSDLAASTSSLPTSTVASIQQTLSLTFSTVSTSVITTSVSISSSPSGTTSPDVSSHSLVVTSLPSITTLVRVVSTSISSISKVVSSVAKETNGPSCGAVRPHGNHGHHHG